MADENDRQLQELLDHMVKLAKSHVQFFNERIRNSKNDQHLIPIDRILGTFDYVSCEVNKSDMINDIVKNAVKQFSSERSAEGIIQTTHSVITKFSDQPPGVQHTHTQYLISVDPLGGIARLDVFYFFHKSTPNHSVLALGIVKSSINPVDVDDNALRVLVNQCFETEDVQWRKEVYKMIFEEFEKYRVVKSERSEEVPDNEYGREVHREGPQPDTKADTAT
ncbi:hypothetical protein RHS04_08120 [Rhizoctonia solani]|uniref:Uncharacterized protein n=1 Tax=Rhizoctonia solani TaxID=456999 RepID=A0A8H7H0K2_9AGAM|nr:hypothetical protein RHS04_08120 [Rhizoctonia solani]